MPAVWGADAEDRDRGTGDLEADPDSFARAAAITQKFVMVRCTGTKRLFQRYEAISVRESNALPILEDLGIWDGKHVLGPTFMLPGSNGSNWLTIPLFHKSRMYWFIG